MSLTTGTRSAGVSVTVRSPPPRVPIAAAAASTNTANNRFAGNWTNPGDAADTDSEVLLAITSRRDGDGRSNVEESTLLADGEYDEEAERAAFQAAVMAWRRGDITADGAARGTAEGAGTPAGGSSSSSGGRKFSAEVGSETGSIEPGGKLLEGSVDEEMEQRAFRAAVDAWRSGAAVVDKNESKSSCFTCYSLFSKVRY
jgi:hypothetical protein